MLNHKTISKSNVFVLLIIVMILGCESSSNPAIIDLTAATLSFGTIETNKTSSLSFTVYCRSKKALKIQKIEMQNTGEFAIVNVLDNSNSLIPAPYTCEIANNEKITVYVEFAPLSVDVFNNIVLISHNAKNELNPAIIDCEGEGILPFTPEITVTPQNLLDYGTVKVCMNQCVDETIEIENSGTDDLLINEIKLENYKEFRIKEILDFNGNALPIPYSTSIKPGEKITATITFTPAEIKVCSDKFIITHNASNFASPYEVNLTGEGAAPTVSVKDTKLLATDGSIRATAYSMSNRIITGGGKIFVTWLDNSLTAKIMSYDITASTWSNVYTVGNGADDKSGPVITMDSSGNIYFAYGPNNGLFTFTRTVSPYDISAWQRTRTFGDAAAYPSLVCDNTDTLHCAYKGGKTPQSLMFQTYTNGNIWTNPLEIVNCGANSSYTQYGNSLAVSSNGDLHLGFHIYDYNIVKAGKYVGYLRSKDGGRTWETVNGTPVNLPANPNTNCFIEQGNNLDMRVGNMVIDDKGKPWLAVTHLEGNPTLKLWHHDGNSWQMIDLLPELQKHMPGQYLSEGTLAFDDTGMLYVTATTLAPGYSTWYGDKSHEVVLFTSADHGQTFDFLQISQPDPNLANWLPCIERPYGPNPIGIPGLLYCHSDKSTPPAEVFFKSFQKQ